MRQIAIVLLVIFLTQGVAAQAHNPTNQPNIVFILADDLGWSDLGCYGHPYHDTPNIDALAARGIRFTNGYAPAPICSASRAAILTGKTTARLNFEFVTRNDPGQQVIDGDVKLETPPFTLNLPLEEVTIAEHLKRLGYTTAMFGKWHLNAHHNRYLGWSPVFGPGRQGFEVAVEDFGSHPYSWTKSKPKEINQPGMFPEDTMIERAVDFIQQEHRRPFFLMVSQFYVHTPVKTPCSWLVDKYEDRAPAGVVRRTNRVRYAAFVEELDHRVGRILDAIDSAGRGKDTLIVFTSDNGGHPEFAANGPLRGSKWNLYEGGVRVPFVIRLPGNRPPAKQCDTPVVGYDLLPTFVDLAGGDAPLVDGTSIVSLLQPKPSAQVSAAGNDFDRHLLWHFPYYHPERGYSDAIEEIGSDDFTVSKTRPQSALRYGNYKLLRFYEGDRYELYNLAIDPGEQHDISSDQPQLTQQLSQRLNSALHESKARLPTQKLVPSPRP